MSVGGEIDHELDELKEKLNLLMEYLGLEFDYDWGDVSGVKKRKEEE